MLKEVTIDIGKVTPNQFIETLETIVLGSVNMSFERAKQVFRNAGEVYLGVQYAFENKDNAVIIVSDRVLDDFPNRLITAIVYKSLCFYQ